MPRTDIDFDADAVRRLVGAHFPHYAALPVTEVATPGTQNMVYRLGQDLCVRLPRRQRVVRRLEKELRWLPAVAARSPLEVPAPVAAVDPGDGFPMPWAIYRWIEGEPVASGAPIDDEESATRLAAFVAALRTLDPADGPPSQQDRSVADRDRDVRRAAPFIGSVLDHARVVDAWQRLVDALPWAGPPTWTHGDLLPSNFLARRGRLAAVIDFGCAGIGDPALDLLPAWAVLGARGRETFRNALGVDEATWRRGRAIALHQAVVIAADQLAWNGPMLPVAVRTGESVLADG